MAPFHYMACFDMSVPGQPPPSPQPDAASLRLSVAPMMDWTDTHCRVFHRLLAPHARLYTEMVHANAVIHGDRDRLLAMDPVEHPVALQLGGSEPGLLRSEEHTSELQSLMRISYAVFCLKKQKKVKRQTLNS